MNENDILCAADMWVKETLPSARCHISFIADASLHIKLIGKKGVRAVFMKNEVKHSKVILDKLINRFPVSFYIEGEPEPEIKLVEVIKKKPMSENDMHIALEKYLAPLSKPKYPALFKISARMIVKIDLKKYPELKAFKTATTILKDFENGHPALADFKQIQIDYFCAGTLVSDYQRRKKAA